MKHPVLLGAALGFAILSAPARGQQPAADAVEAASQTFIHGCVAHLGAYDQLRRRLQPGQDLYLPQLPAKEAGLFLQGREGEAYARPDAGVTLVLLGAEAQCAVFVRKAPPDRLYRRLEQDLRAALGQSFAIQAGGREGKGALQSRFIDMNPKGEYRAELVKRFGGEPTGLRMILTTSETANPNLQAIITIGTRQP
ncbi:hypothetical protein [Magnetospirillum sp. SS-4]|uniref:NMCC_0638 family (lipo)protein n=1 Tax=Magnetospirillum sp. SS-4 TaxID=2681465 RepID=UPI0013818D5F|nr:hypothetical protein [Magnetospirillum sp. SS-4]CAA7619390.1 conserved exported hypothetical protein [Magnetospirillum sp. SS-4]